jgi:hypothetical protein
VNTSGFAVGHVREDSLQLTEPGFAAISACCYKSSGRSMHVAHMMDTVGATDSLNAIQRQHLGGQTHESLSTDH